MQATPPSAWAGSSPHLARRPSALGSPARPPSKHLITVVPPSSLPHDPPHARTSPLCSGYGPASKFRRGTLVPLYPTLSGQLGAIARAYGLPSTGGLTVYLVDAAGAAGLDQSQSSLVDALVGPRVGDEAWQMLWAPVFEAEAHEHELREATVAAARAYADEIDGDDYDDLGGISSADARASPDDEGEGSADLEPPPSFAARNGNPFRSRAPPVPPLPMEHRAPDDTERGASPSDDSVMTDDRSHSVRGQGVASPAQGSTRSTSRPARARPSVSSSSRPHSARSSRFHPRNSTAASLVAAATAAASSRRAMSSYSQSGLPPSSAPVDTLAFLTAQPPPRPIIVGKIEFDIDRRRPAGRWFEQWLESASPSAPSSASLRPDASSPMAARSASAPGSSNLVLPSLLSSARPDPSPLAADPDPVDELAGTGLAGPVDAEGEDLSSIGPQSSLSRAESVASSHHDVSRGSYARLEDDAAPVVESSEGEAAEATSDYGEDAASSTRGRDPLADVFASDAATWSEAQATRPTVEEPAATETAATTTGLGIVGPPMLPEDGGVEEVVQMIESRRTSLSAVNHALSSPIHNLPSPDPSVGGFMPVQSAGPVIRDAAANDATSESSRSSADMASQLDDIERALAELSPRARAPPSPARSRARSPITQITPRLPTVPDAADRAAPASELVADVPGFGSASPAEEAAPRSPLPEGSPAPEDTPRPTVVAKVGPSPTRTSSLAAAAAAALPSSPPPPVPPRRTSVAPVEVPLPPLPPVKIQPSSRPTTAHQSSDSGGGLAYLSERRSSADSVVGGPSAPSTALQPPGSSNGLNSSLRSISPLKFWTRRKNSGDATATSPNLSDRGEQLSPTATTAGNPFAQGIFGDAPRSSPRSPKSPNIDELYPPVPVRSVSPAPAPASQPISPALASPATADLARSASSNRSHRLSALLSEMASHGDDPDNLR